MKNLLKLILLSILFFTVSSCGDDDTSTGGENTDNYDRTAMLTFLADDIIIPGYESYLLTLSNLKAASDAFTSTPDEPHFDALRDAWLTSYTSWQKVSMFEIGKAEAIGIRNFTNIFPADVDQIQINIDEGDSNLALPSNFSAQGFPALDYLLFGIATDKQALIDLLQQPTYNQYLNDLVTRLEDLTYEVLQDWVTNYRTTFINNNSSSATASVDKLVNDFIFYYEKFLRAGKVGIPAGVFSGSAISTSVEAPYSGIHSLVLLNASLDAVQDFFNGQSRKDNTTGPGLHDYLNFLNSIVEGENLVAKINAQLDVIRNSAAQLNPNLKVQVEEDPIKMLETYDELQKLVILFKVDMLQVLNIRVDFVDADGD